MRICTCMCTRNFFSYFIIEGMDCKSTGFIRLVFNEYTRPSVGIYYSSYMLTNTLTHRHIVNVT